MHQYRLLPLSLRVFLLVNTEHTVIFHHATGKIKLNRGRSWGIEHILVPARWRSRSQLIASAMVGLVDGCYVCWLEVVEGWMGLVRAIIFDWKGCYMEKYFLYRATC